MKTKVTKESWHLSPSYPSLVPDPFSTPQYHNQTAGARDRASWPISTGDQTQDCSLGHREDEPNPYGHLLRLP